MLASESRGRAGWRPTGAQASSPPAIPASRRHSLASPLGLLPPLCPAGTPKNAAPPAASAVQTQAGGGVLPQLLRLPWGQGSTHPPFPRCSQAGSGGMRPIAHQSARQAPAFNCPDCQNVLACWRPVHCPALQSSRLLASHVGRGLLLQRTPSSPPCPACSAANPPALPGCCLLRRRAATAVRAGVAPTRLCAAQSGSPAASRPIPITGLGIPATTRACTACVQMPTTPASAVPTRPAHQGPGFYA